MQIQLLDLRAQFIFEQTFTNDLALERFSALRKQSAGADQVGESFFCNQATDCHDQRRCTGKIGSSEFGEIQPIVNAMNDIGTFRKLLTQKLCSVIGLGDDYARCIHELIKSNLERPRHKNVVGVRGKAKRDWKKSVDPESGPRRHPRKVRVNVPNPQFLQAQPDVNSLIEPKKIRAPAPFIESSHDIRREFSLFPSTANIIQQFLLLR